MKSIQNLLVFAALTLSSTFALAQYNKLNAADPVAKVVNHFGIEWNDRNITSGTSKIEAVLWNTPTMASTRNLEQAMVKVLQQKVESQSSGASNRLKNTKAETQAMDKTGLSKIVKSYKMANDFADSNVQDANYAVATVYAIIRNLDQTQKDLVLTKVSTVYTEDGETRIVELYALTNTKTAKAALFYFIEGHM